MTASRTDKKCGASYIPNTAKCTKGSGVATAAKAVAAAGIAAGGAVALRSRLKPKPTAVTKIRMTPTMGLKVSRATKSGLRRHKAAVLKGQKRHKAAVATAVSKGQRRHQAAILKMRRKYEPGFSKRRKLGSFYKGDHKQTGYVRDRLSKIMDGMRKPKY